jgi:hypothetical protein
MPEIVPVRTFRTCCKAGGAICPAALSAPEAAADAPSSALIPVSRAATIAPSIAPFAAPATLPPTSEVVLTSALALLLTVSSVTPPTF